MEPHTAGGVTERDMVVGKADHQTEEDKPEERKWEDKQPEETSCLDDRDSKVGWLANTELVAEGSCIAQYWGSNQIVGSMSHSRDGGEPGGGHGLCYHLLLQYDHHEAARGYMPIPDYREDRDFEKLPQEAGEAARRDSCSWC